MERRFRQRVVRVRAPASPFYLIEKLCEERCEAFFSIQSSTSQALYRGREPIMMVVSLVMV
jgi:hypothetical protein